MKTPKFINNKSSKVYDELIEYIKPNSSLSIMSAYFTIYAFEALKNELSTIEKFQFIYTEPTFINQNSHTMKEFFIKKNSNIFGTEFEIHLRNEMEQTAIAKECSAWIKNKAEFKSFKSKNTGSSKSLIIENINNVNTVLSGVDISADGLGIEPSDRIDQIFALYDAENIKQAIMQFNNVWNSIDVEHVTDEVLESMEVLYKENPPEFIYIISLYNIFYDYLGELTDDTIIKEKTGFRETKIWNTLYGFQRDGVIGAIDKIEKYQGCILADSVGLGKTFTALAVMKYYELRNDRILVLCPKKIRDNWTVYTQNDKRNILLDDRFGYDVLNHTDLSRESGLSGAINLATVNWGNYDLVVIDESHNFRNNPPVKDRVTRYQRLMNDVIKSGVTTKVLMLSATPVNNRMNDIKNQIAFITEGKDNALQDVGIKSIGQSMRLSQQVFNEWSDLPPEERTTENFVNRMSMDYFKILDTLTIARSRKHIEKYYDMEEIGKFPDRLPPINKYSEIDLTDSFPSISDVNKTIASLKLAVYSPLAYVFPNKVREYESTYDMEVGPSGSVFRQRDRESSLIHLMRVNLLKRLESSIYAFTLTLGRLLAQVDSTLESITNHPTSFQHSDVNIEEIDPDDIQFEDLLVGNKVKVLLQDVDTIKWKQDLESDKEKLEQLLEESKKVTPEKDAKLDELKTTMKSKFATPINNNNRKILIFTAFADTANYLYDNLSIPLKNLGINAALVTGSGNNKSTIDIPKGYRNQIKFSDINTTLTLFSPISKEREKTFPFMEDSIDVLIGTDCISEGQNLQDCDYLVNYDIHWNPVRIIQRFGRIDRIGSKNDRIQLVNFWPTEDLDEYINLEQRVQGRMVLLDVSATGEENLISSNDKREMQDLEYRRNQLERLRSEVVDLEDISGGISITDLTFSDFKVDLMNYMKENRGNLEKTPTGLYSIAEIDPMLQGEVEEGVIFVLEQVKGAELAGEQNPLYPYYIIYVTENGKVELSFTKAKKLLDYLKKMSHGKSEVNGALVERFNADTNSGLDMSAYSSLLQTAIGEIVGIKDEVGLNSLFSKGGTSIHDSNRDGMGDFELITFLILKNGDKDE